MDEVTNDAMDNEEVNVEQPIDRPHYPPGTQENYNSFSSRNLIMGKGKELKFPEGWGGGKGSEVACDLNLIARSAMGEPPVPPIDRVEQMRAVQQQALELFKKKNADYGDAFATYGVVGVIVRIGDKIQRLSSVTRNGVTLVNDENLKDTLIDLHNYSAMALMLADPLLKKVEQNLPSSVTY
jgi:Nucleotide modification associated domain 1